jgi:hypothetical protein
VPTATAGEAAQAARAVHRDSAGLHRELCQIGSDTSVYARNKQVATEQAQTAAAVAAFEQRGWQFNKCIRYLLMKEPSLTSMSARPKRESESVLLPAPTKLQHTV